MNRAGRSGENAASSPRLGLGIHLPGNVPFLERVFAGDLPSLDYFEVVYYPKLLHCAVPDFSPTGIARSIRHLGLARRYHRNMRDLEGLGKGHRIHADGLDASGVGPADEDYIRRVDRLAERIGAQAVVEDIGFFRVGSQVFDFFIQPVLDSRFLRLVVDKVRKNHSLLGHEYLVENPPFCTWVGDLHILDFMETVARECEAGILLDVGHLLNFQSLKQLPARDLRARLECFPLERVRELHVAGLKPVASPYPHLEDMHTVPVVDEQLSVLDYLVRHAPNLDAVTVEVHRCFDWGREEEALARVALENFRKVRAVCRSEAAATDEAPAAARPAPPVALRAPLAPEEVDAVGQAQRLYADLLYDEQVRERFLRDPRGLVATYRLDEETSEAFSRVEPELLRQEVEARAGL